MDCYRLFERWRQPKQISDKPRLFYPLWKALSIKQGFELQSFLHLDLFGIDKARLFESQKFIQQNLFDEVEHGIKQHSNPLRKLPDNFNKYRTDFGTGGANQQPTA